MGIKSSEIMILVKGRLKTTEIEPSGYPRKKWQCSKCGNQLWIVPAYSKGDGGYVRILCCKIQTDIMRIENKKGQRNWVVYRDVNNIEEL